MVSRTASAGLVLAVVLVLAAPAAGNARSTVDPMPAVVTVPGSVYFGYLSPVVVVDAGAELTYGNLDTAEHDFVQDVEADGFGGSKKAPWCKSFKSSGHGHDHGHGCPAFYTPLLETGETASVEGISGLEPGEYSFYCTKHHTMKGSLIVR